MPAFSWAGLTEVRFAAWGRDRVEPSQQGSMVPTLWFQKRSFCQTACW